MSSICCQRIVGCSSQMKTQFFELKCVKNQGETAGDVTIIQGAASGREPSLKEELTGHVGLSTQVLQELVVPICRDRSLDNGVISTRRPRIP